MSTSVNTSVCASASTSCWVRTSQNLPMKVGDRTKTDGACWNLAVSSDGGWWHTMSSPFTSPIFHYETGTESVEVARNSMWERRRPKQGNTTLLNCPILPSQTVSVGVRYIHTTWFKLLGCDDEDFSDWMTKQIVLPQHLFCCALHVKACSHKYNRLLLSNTGSCILWTRNYL